MAIQERAELRLSWRIEAQQEAAQADGAGLAFSIFDLFTLLKLLTLLGCRQRGCNPQKTSNRTARGTQRPKRLGFLLSAAPQPASMSSRETDWLDPSANVITAAE